MGDSITYHAAVDLGASSGRVLLGWLEPGTAAATADVEAVGAATARAAGSAVAGAAGTAAGVDAAAAGAAAGAAEGGVIHLEEVHRFDNLQRRVNGHDCWDIQRLFDEIVRGLALCKSAHGVEPATVAIDTWGVDFVLLDEADRLIGDCVAYRDARTNGALAVADAMISPERVYELTGIQRQPFNTLYQLIALAGEHPEQLEAARTFLMVPDYLNWRLTGKKANEYTNATTTGMLNARTLEWEGEILDACGIPRGIFLSPSMPGASLGPVTAEISARIGYAPEVILCASHDTGSAYLAVPATDEHSAFLSSGTWSLFGCENASPITSDAARMQNFTNEGGYERRYRFLKNIMGLWMIQSVRRELNGVNYVAGKTEHVRKGDHEYGFGELSQLAREAGGFEAFVDVDDERFLSPDSMIEEVRDACRETSQPVPVTTGQLMRVLYLSLARSYAGAVANLSQLTGRAFERINIVGGGCQDAYLNEMCARACGLPVLAGPVEGTGLGNLMVQMIHAAEFDGVDSARAAVARSFDVKLVEP